MSATTYPHLVAVDGVLQHPTSRKATQRRASASSSALTAMQAAILDADTINRACGEMRDAVRAFVTAARTGDLIVVRALARDLDIEAAAVAHIADCLGRRLEDLNAGGGA